MSQSVSSWEFHSTQPSLNSGSLLSTGNSNHYSTQAWAKDAEFIKEWGPTGELLFEESDHQYADDIMRTIWCLHKRFSNDAERCKARILDIILSTPNRRQTLEDLGIILALFNERPFEDIAPKFLESFYSYDLFRLKIQAFYLEIFKLKLAAPLKSFPGYTDQTKELIITTETSRLLARGLIDDTGEINRGALEFFARELRSQFSFLPESHKNQIDLILFQLSNDQEFKHCLLTIGKPHKQIHTDLIIQLKRTKNAVMTEVDARRAALTALLSYPRQERSDCFVQSLIIGVLQHDPILLLRHLKNLIEQGSLPIPGLFPQHQVSMNCDRTFHSPYASRNTTSAELLNSLTIKTVLNLLGIEPRAADNPSAVTTPRNELKRLIALQFPEPAQAEKRRTLLNLGMNMLSSYFQNHLLQNLASHAMFISDNCLNDKSSPRALFLSTIGTIPTYINPFQPLEDSFSKLVQNRIHFQRIEKEEDIQIFKSLGISREEILQGLGLVCCYNPSNNQSTFLYTWEQVGTTIINLLKESLTTVSSSSDSMIIDEEISKAISQIPLSSLTDWLKRLITEMAGSKQHSLLKLLNSQYCAVSLIGGRTSVLLDNFLGISPKRFKINEPNAERALYAIAATLKANIDTRSSKPPLVLCRDHKKGSQNNGHIYTIAPNNPTLSTLWNRSASEEDMRNRIQVVANMVEKNSNIPLTHHQKLFMTTWLDKQLKDIPLQFLAAVTGFAREGVHASQVVQNWKAIKQATPAFKNSSVLQGALNEAVELLNWDSWSEDLMKYFVERIPNTQFPPDFSKERTAALLMKACQEARKEMIKNGDIQANFGMTVHCGAKVLFSTFKNHGFSVDYSNVLWILCAKHGFPLRFQIGDTNYAIESGKKEIWVGPNYGNDREPLGFFYADGIGNFLTNEIPRPTIDYLYIQNAQKPTTLYPCQKV